MYSKILVAVDGSGISAHALKQAITLARKLKAQLRIVHVVDMNWFPLAPELNIDIQTISAVRRSVGESIIAAARDSAKQERFEAEVALLETDSPAQQVAEAITQEAQRWPADMMVLGTHGHRGFQRLMLGSVAEQTARRSVMPVLLIPSPEHTHSD
ncbi:MAG: universal stress protein [Gammaproteobacteria bacterium]|nr:universal stress protein [Gammaproteobacteria bacterium]MBU1967612.1 universal stress protein [Gammaproteobacteria bacterium]